MEININVDLDKEIFRYYFTASRICIGTYGKSIFYLVDKSPKDKILNSYVAVFPDYNINEKLEWHTLRDESLIHGDLSGLSSYEDLKGKIYEEFGSLTRIQPIIEESWKKYEERFLHTLSEVIPDIMNSLNQDLVINIYLTNIGSPSSFNIKSTTEVEIYYRVDCDISSIAEMILTSIYKISEENILNKLKNKYEHNDDWVITEAVTDFMLSRTILNKLFPNFVPTLGARDLTLDNGLNKKNYSYLAKLGFSPDSTYYISDNEIYTTTNKRLEGLNNQEKTLMMLLVANLGRTCTFDLIAEAIWKDAYIQKFSMVAINKLVFSLRHKLRMNNLPKSTIKTVRGVGYSLSIV